MNIESQYDIIAQDFDISRVRIWNSVKDFLLDKNNKKTLLDVGCGNGKNMVYAIKLGYTVKGSDISNKLIEICEKKELNVIKSDIVTDTDYTNKFDKILCIAVIHHINTLDDQKKAIINMLHKLNSNGNLLISVWSYEKTDKFDITGKIEKIQKNVKDYRDFVIGDNWVPWNTKLDRYYYIHNFETFHNMFKEINKIIPINFKITWEKQNWFCNISII